MGKNKMKAFIVVVICLFLASPVIQGIQPQKSLIDNHDLLLDGGWLEERDGVVILHVSGSNYEMGYQHGYLLREKVQANIRAFLSYAQNAITYAELLAMWDIMAPYIPQEYIEELQGIADGANVSFNDLAASITAIECADHGCFGIAAWGPATADGILYQARSFDLPSTVQDPVTGMYAYENSVLIVRDPTNGSASLCPSIAGSFHTGGGINENGVGIGLQICWSKDQTLQGNPYHFRVQQTLDDATTAEEAVTIINTNRTHGYNIIVSDAATPIGYIIEQSANHTYVGTYDDSVESTSPFWSIDHVVRRTNCFIDPTIAATQRKRYDPTGLLGFLNLVFFKKTNCPYFAIYRLYKSVSNELTEHWGSLTLNTTMDALQKGYRADTDLLLRLIERLGRGTGMAEAWNQWTACPQTGDMVVSFATRDKKAFETEVHYFNFFELMDSEPP
jgi:predicted choloylglycine hydrolase